MSALCHFTYSEQHLALFDQHSRIILPRFVYQAWKHHVSIRMQSTWDPQKKRKTLNSFSLSVSFCRRNAPKHRWI